MLRLNDLETRALVKYVSKINQAGPLLGFNYDLVKANLIRIQNIIVERKEFEVLNE